MKLFFATSNPGKVEDVVALLADTPHTVERLDVEMLEPQEATLEEIVRFKVEQAAEQVDVDGAIMADDSGLFVEDLNGFPGVLSSPFYDLVGMEGLITLAGEGAAAEFRAAIACKTPDNTVTVFHGSCAGSLVAPRGTDGFGYDPIFLPEGHDKTFAEDVAYKRQVSHREAALRKLRAWLARQG